MKRPETPVTFRKEEYDNTGEKIACVFVLLAATLAVMIALIAKAMS